MSDPAPTNDRTAAHVPAGPPSTVDDAGRSSTADVSRADPSTESAALPPGYELVGRLGRGGMGVVYRARQVRANRDVALKMILAGEHADPRERERFRTEAEAVAGLSHPNVVAVYEVGEHAGRPFFSMELCPGGTLAAKLAGTPLRARDAAVLVEKLARGVVAAHTAGVIHRDLKPGNVLFAADGEPKVTDFGLAKLVNSDDGLTATGAVMGTPSYMAPEQAFGESKRVGPTADVYALGAVLYECLTGRPPFKGVTSADTLDQVRNQEPAAPRSLDGAIPRDLETICLKCLAKEPTSRYPTAAELADDLAHYLVGRPIAARPVGILERAWKSVKRNREASVGAAAVFFVLVVATILSTILAVRARDEASRANTAEADKQRRLAESYLDQARLLIQRGQWEGALASLDRAIAEGHPDPTSVRVQKVRVYFALNQTERAKAELDGLESADGMAELLRADLYLGTDNEAAVRHARRAMERGLPNPERAYVEGLMALDAVAAETGFRRAVELEPYHLRANQLLGWVLIVQGKTADALRHVAQGRAFFPDDPNLGSMELLALAAQGKQAEVETAYRRAALGLASDDRRVIWAVTRLLVEMHDLEEVLAMPELELFLKFQRSFASSPPGLDPVPADRPLGRYVFPPFLERSFSSFGDLFAKSSVADMVVVYQRLARDPAALMRIVEVVNESTLLFLRGYLLINEGKYRQAQAVLTQAVTAPALFDTRRLALTLLSVAEWQLAAQTRGDEQRNWLGAAAGHLNKLMKVGGTPRYYTAHAIDAAIDCKELELARRMAADYEMWSPMDVGARLRRAHLERVAGNHAGAIERYEWLMAKNLSVAEATDVARGLRLSQAAIRDLAKKQPPPPELAPPPRRI